MPNTAVKESEPVRFTKFRRRIFEDNKKRQDAIREAVENWVNREAEQSDYPDEAA